MKTLTVEDFTARTASGEATPGGGSISALAGALAAALTRMVAGLTVGRKKYQEAEQEMQEIIPVMEKLYGQLLDDINRDCQSFDSYMQALTLPKDTPEEKEQRAAAMQDGLKAAVYAPLDVAEKVYAIFPCIRLVAEKGNTTALSDALVAALMARTAVLGSAFNVKINLKSIKDEEFVRKTFARIDELEKKAVQQEAEILAFASDRLN